MSRFPSSYASYGALTYGGSYVGAGYINDRVSYVAPVSSGYVDFHEKLVSERQISRAELASSGKLVTNSNAYHSPTSYNYSSYRGSHRPVAHPIHSSFSPPIKSSDFSESIHNSYYTAMQESKRRTSSAPLTAYTSPLARSYELPVQNYVEPVHTAPTQADVSFVEPILTCEEPLRPYTEHRGSETPLPPLYTSYGELPYLPNSLPTPRSTNSDSLPLSSHRIGESSGGFSVGISSPHIGENVWGMSNGIVGGSARASVGSSAQFTSYGNPIVPGGSFGSPFINEGRMLP